jgi:hypothetical protein
MKLRAFLFDSAYQVVTWVLIALSIGAIFFFLSQQNYRGAIWSGVALLVCIGIMLGLLAVRYVTEWKAANVPLPPTNRPWLNVEVAPGGPIVYRQQKAEIAIFIPVTYRVINRGHSPSSDIELKATVFFARPGDLPIERQRKICEWKEEGHPFRPGVVFPATPEEYKVTYSYPISYLKKAGESPSYPPGYEVNHFDAYVGGCIRYPCGGTPIFYGETGFLYEIQVHDERNPATTIVPEIGKEIPLERLTFRRYFPGGGEWAK